MLGKKTYFEKIKNSAKHKEIAKKGSEKSVKKRREKAEQRKTFRDIYNNFLDIQMRIKVLKLDAKNQIVYDKTGSPQFEYKYLTKKEILGMGNIMRMEKEGVKNNDILHLASIIGEDVVEKSESNIDDLLSVLKK
jgi:hypothetical protein